jgi:hypothetical protein
MAGYGYGISVSGSRTPVVASGGGEIIPSSGLSLWLKADAGVTTASYTYKSNIALSEAGQTTINGNYAPSSTPAINSNYMLVGPNSNFIEVRPNSSPVYRLFNENNNIDGGPSYYDFISSNGTTWSFGDGKRPVSITIANLTGASAQANGTYNTFVGTVDGGITNWIAYETINELGVLKVYQNGDCDLFRIISGNPTLIATGSNWGIGSFTIVSPATGSPIGSGTIYPTGGVPTGVVTTTTVDTTDVASWADQSGNGKNATAIVSPIYSTNSINGKPALVFANNAYLTTANIFNGANPRSMFAVYYIDSENYSNTVIAQSNEETTDTGTYFMLQSRIDLDSSPYLAGYGDDLSGPPFVNQQLLLGMADYDGTTARLFKNGTQANSESKSYNTHNGAFYIGAFNEAGFIKEEFGGKIAEIVVYSRVLTTPERQQVEAYLMDKYAIEPAPSGIPVATTNEIVLSGLTLFDADLNGVYTKSGDPTNVTAGGVDGEATGAVFFNSAYTGGNKDGAAIWYGPILFGSGNGWQITGYNDNRFRLGSIESADTTTVPVSGYSNDAGYTGTIILSAL